MVTVTLENSHFCLNFKSPNFRDLPNFLLQSNIDFTHKERYFVEYFVEYYQLFAKSRCKLFAEHKESFCKT